MPKMFLIDLKGSKKQLLDEQATLKVIENDFDKINQITTLQETEMRYRVKLQDNKQFLVESTRMEAFIDEYFPMMESMQIEEAVDWEKTGFYPMVRRLNDMKDVWYGREIFDRDEAEEICSEQAEKRTNASKYGNEYVGRVIDSDGLLVYTEDPDEEINPKYIETPSDEEEPAEVGKLSAEEEKAFADAAKLEGPKAEKTGEVDPETGEEVNGGSFVETIKGAFKQHKIAYEKEKHSLEEFQAKVKSGEISNLSQEQIQHNIATRKARMADAAAEMKDDMARLDQAVLDYQEKQATADRRHADLKKYQGLDHLKKTRMADTNTNNQNSFDDLLARFGGDTNSGESR